MNLSSTAAPPVAARLWPSVVILLLGIGAGMQLGKVAPLIPRLQAEARLSLTFTGWLTSLMGLFVALAAYPATRFVSRLGASGSMKLGGAVLSTGAIALALAPTPALLAARTIEAAGYVVVVIAAPAYLATRTPERTRPVLMALWGSFVPVGYALANMQVSLMPQTWSASGVFASFAVPIGILTVLANLFVSDKSPATSPRQDRARVHPDGILVAVAFGLYVYLSIGFFTFLPRYQADHASHLWMPSGAVALFVPLGNVIAALLLGILGAGSAGRLCMFAFVAAAVAGALAFTGTGASGLAIPAFALSGGLAASSLFAGVTARVADEAAATALIGTIAQAGGIATLLGPPLAGHIAETYGWAPLSWSFATVGMLAAVVVAASDPRRSSRARS